MPYLQTLIAGHRDHPGDDVVSGIVTGLIAGREPDEAEILNMIITIMLAGHITTTSGTGNMVLRLARDPELQTLLRDHPDRIPDAIEESLRIDTPQQAMPRKCLADVELGGQTIKAGEYVLMNFGSANVDPEAWEAADAFDLDRPNRRHVAFGRGLHQCIGQNLARLEIRIAVEELLARTASFTLDGTVHRLTWPLLCVEHLPMSLTPRRAE
jgi:cytochrome P450